MSLPRIAIGSLGGTIGMTPDAAAGGVIPRLGASQLAASVPGLSAIAQLTAQTLFQLPSASIQLPHVLASLQWAHQQVEAGAAGVVLTQGTDSIEETAYLLELFWNHQQPLIVTGAMRAPDAPGADGPANLLAAAITAAAPNSRGRGVLVVMNDEVHHARWVQKTHSLAVQAFGSPDVGPIGRIVEKSVHYVAPPATRNALPLPVFAEHAKTLLQGGLAHTNPPNNQRETSHTTIARPDTNMFGPKVAMLETYLGDDGLLASLAVQSGYVGLVIAGMGAGHVSFDFAERINGLCQHVPVVIASRTGAGPTASATYGYKGSEVDLMRRGALMAGWLGARKARLLLWALLAVNTPRTTLARHWEAHTRSI